MIPTIILFTALAQTSTPSHLMYRRVTIAELTARQYMNTPVSVKGWLTYTRKQRDGDKHIRICDSPLVVGMDRVHCIVAEIVPSHPVNIKRFRHGSHIHVFGTAYFDSGHNWSEVHPVELLYILP